MLITFQPKQRNITLLLTSGMCEFSVSKKMNRFKALFKSTREHVDVESKPVEDWTVQDFQEWLKDHDYQKKVTQSK